MYPAIVLYMFVYCTARNNHWVNNRLSSFGIHKGSSSLNLGNFYLHSQNNSIKVSSKQYGILVVRCQSEKCCAMLSLWNTKVIIYNLYDDMKACQIDINIGYCGHFNKQPLSRFSGEDRKRQWTSLLSEHSFSNHTGKSSNILKPLLCFVFLSWF